jgi:hypothetical protein
MLAQGAPAIRHKDAPLLEQEDGGGGVRRDDGRRCRETKGTRRREPTPETLLADAMLDVAALKDARKK